MPEPTAAVSASPAGSSADVLEADKKNPTKVGAKIQFPDFMDAYIFFYDQNRDSVEEEYKLRGILAIGRKCKELWAAMSEDERKPYETKVQKAKDEFEAEEIKKRTEDKERKKAERAFKSKVTKKSQLRPKNPIQAWAATGGWRKICFDI